MSEKKESEWLAMVADIIKDRQQDYEAEMFQLQAFIGSTYWKKSSLAFQGCSLRYRRMIEGLVDILEIMDKEVYRMREALIRKEYEANQASEEKIGGKK